MSSLDRNVPDRVDVTKEAELPMRAMNHEAVAAVPPAVLAPRLATVPAAWPSGLRTAIRGIDADLAALPMDKSEAVKRAKERS